MSIHCSSQRSHPVQYTFCASNAALPNNIRSVEKKERINTKGSKISRCVQGLFCANDAAVCPDVASRSVLAGAPRLPWRPVGGLLAAALQADCSLLAEANNVSVVPPGL